MHPPDERHLRTLLRDEAERHYPDRAAMLSRISRGRAAAADRPVELLRGALAGTVRTRPAAAAFSGVLLLVLGIAGFRLFPPDLSTPGTPIAASAGADAAPAVVSADGSPSAAATGRSRPPTTTSGAPASAPASAPAGANAPPVRDDFLAASGVLGPNSNAAWAQSEVTLTATEKLTAAKVTVRIARTDGVADAGHWTSIPGDRVTTSVAADDDELIYRFAVGPGVTLTPGRYTFAVQYRHAGARALTGDSYLVAARGAGKRKTDLTGGFTGR